MQATVLAAENEICARAWKLSALFCIAEHPNIYDSSMQLLPDYVRGLLLKQFKHMRNKENSMKSVNLLSFIMPRTVQNRHDCLCLLSCMVPMFLGYPRLKRCSIVPLASL
jgi:hypothetical protein